MRFDNALVKNIGLDTLASILCRQFTLLLLKHGRRLHQILLVVLLPNKVQVTLLLVLVRNDRDPSIDGDSFTAHLLLKVDVVYGVFAVNGAFRADIERFVGRSVEFGLVTTMDTNSALSSMPLEKSRMTRSLNRVRI